MSWAQSSSERWLSDDVRGGEVSSRRANVGVRPPVTAPAPSPNAERVEHARARLRQRLDEILMFVELELDPGINNVDRLWADD